MAQRVTRSQANRSHPYERADGGGAKNRGRHDEEELEVVPANSIKVSGTADVNTLAAQVCKISC